MRTVSMSTTPQPQPIGPAARKVLASIDDPELDARYPNRTHFIDAQNPDRVGGGALVQLPPRTQVEVRDASGLPLAA